MKSKDFQGASENFKRLNPHIFNMDSTDVAPGSLLEPKTGQDIGEGIFFVIPGNPVAKPRMTNRDRWFKRPITTRYWEWVNAAKLVIPPLPPDAQRVELVIFVEFPKSWGRKKRAGLSGEPNRGRKDVDNYLKAALDTIFPDQDCAIWSVSVEKRWEDGKSPRMEVKIT